MKQSDIERALADISAGRPVVVVDDEARENEGDLIFAAEKATPELLAFVIRHTSGYVCVAIAEEECERLQLPPMSAANGESFGTAFTVTVDAARGVGTGISAVDRARTIRLLGSPATEPGDLVRPGHVLPLRARRNGVLERPGHTEAAADLARMAGLTAAGGLCEIVSPRDESRMASGEELNEFALEHDLAIIHVADLVDYRMRNEHHVSRGPQARIPTPHGDFVAHGYLSLLDGREHIAMVRGDLTPSRGLPDPLVRIHSECLTGDVLHSLRCDCGLQLEASLAAIGAEGRGAVVYLRGHEGRGIGLLRKLQAYGLQETGHDTVDANLEMGLPVDARDYRVGAQILSDLGVSRLRLLTNNPSKQVALEGSGLTVSECVPLTSAPNPENLTYLRTKRDRLGHRLQHLDTSPRVSEARV